MSHDETEPKATARPPRNPTVESAFERAMEGLRLRTEAHVQTVGLDACRFDVDLDEGVIRFAHADGRRAEAPVQVVGTLNLDDETWLWGWDHPSVRPELAVSAQAALAFGEQHGVAELTTRKLSNVSEAQAWEFAALARELAEGQQGAYRAPAGNAVVFLTFGSLRLWQEPSANEADGAFGAGEPGVDEKALLDAAQAPDAPAELHERVLSFIAAYDRWERDANALSTDDDDDDDDDDENESLIEARFAQLLADHRVVPDEPQGLAWGSEPAHPPDRETIIASAWLGDRASVFTEATDEDDFTTRHEYVFRRRDDGWVLTRLYYLSDDGKYDCL